ncbi:MAG: histidine kinase dimerization/phospho-acceptor domain-containing protein [Pseudomonadota bacterium]
MHHTEQHPSATSKIYTAQGLLEVINGLPLAIAVIDNNRKVALANRATYAFTNKNEQQLIGHVGGDAFGCVHHDDVPEGCGFGQECQKCLLRSTVFNTMEKQESYHLVETIMEFKQVGKRHLRISTQPMVLNNEQVVLLSIEDITEAKKLEQIALQKEKLSAVVQTAGAICHEMNQPLMALMGFSELLSLQMGDDDTRKSNINEIQKQAERLGSITRKLMNITRYKTKDYLSSTVIDIDAASNKNDSHDDRKEP